MCYVKYRIVEDTKKEERRKEEVRSAHFRLLTQPGCDVCTRCSAHHNLLE